MIYLFYIGLVSALVLAGFARAEGSWGEMRAHLVSAILFASLVLERLL